MLGEDELDFGTRLCRNIPELMKVMTAEVRFEFLRSLARKPKCVTELHTELAMKQPAASQHLKPLRQAGLILFDQLKSERVYRLSDRVQVSIENGHIFLSVAAEDGDVLSVRTHIPCVSVPAQSLLWPWARTLRATDNGSG